MTRRPDAMFLVADGLTILNRKQVVAFAATHRIPAMYADSFIVGEGGLMSNGPRLEDGSRQDAFYIDRIFKGREVGRPAGGATDKGLPRRQSQTAETLGLTNPPSLLRADQ